MTGPALPRVPPDLRALLARQAARKPRRVQRAEYRAKLVERATANYRRTGGPPTAHNPHDPCAMAPKPPGVGFVNRRGGVKEPARKQAPRLPVIIVTGSREGKSATAATRAKFDTLFANPRHFRGDCRLLRTAVRRGWLNDAPQADRDRLVARFSAAIEERKAAGFQTPGQQIRAILAWVRVAVEMEGDELRERSRVFRYAWAGELTDRTTGRPRERWYVTDCPGRIDAAEVRRQALAAGMDLGNLREVRVTVTAEGDTPRVKPIQVEARAVAVGGWRVFLCCPRCGHRRVYLFAMARGVGCRQCLRVRHADRPNLERLKRSAGPARWPG